MPLDDPILLILDLDETLIHAAEAPLPGVPDFRVGPFVVYRRPHLAAFLAACAAHFRLAFWSTASEDYVAGIVAHILPPGVTPAFTWGHGRCVRRYDPELFEDHFVKDLKKVKRRGYRLERVLIADDTPRKVARHYGNAVYVPPFLGDPDDAILPPLADYLATLRDAPDVRRIEKRGWSRARPGVTTERRSS